MTASVTMRMWRSMSCAFWRPDPRHGDEPREPLRRLDIARRDGLPRRFRSSTLRACGAGRLALEQNPSARDFNGLGRTPRTCARGCRRGSRSYPQFRCTNLTPSYAQTPAVNIHPAMESARSRSSLLECLAIGGVRGVVVYTGRVTNLRCEDAIERSCIANDRIRDIAARFCATPVAAPGAGRN